MKKLLSGNLTSHPSPAIKESGAITIRFNNKNMPEVLLILSKKKPKVRIFPKGHIEKGEKASAAAKRELLEEAGIKGRLIGYAGKVSYNFKGKKYLVSYYLFQFETFVTNGERGRRPQWYSINDAYSVLPFEGLKEILEKAIKKLKKVGWKD